MNRMFILYSLLVLSKKKQITNKNFYSIATPKAMAHTGTPTVYHQSSATCADSDSMFNSRTGRAQIHSQLIQIQICPQAHTNKHITDTHTHTHTATDSGSNGTDSNFNTSAISISMRPCACAACSVVVAPFVDQTTTSLWQC